MRLYSFRIRNFKSIADSGEIKISDDDNVTIFAGQNEAGKSAILEALEFFENGATVSDFDETYRKVETFPRIECTYTLSSEELDTLETKANKDLRKYIEQNKFTFVRGSTSSDDFETIKYSNLPEQKALVDSLNSTKAEADPDAELFNLGYLFEERPKFIFYSGFESYILPNKITKTQLGTNDAVSDFETVFNVDFDSLLSEQNTAKRNRVVSIVNKSASADLNEYWSQKLEDEPSVYNFNIDVNITEPVAESSVTFLIDQNDDNFLYFGQKSTGFRWFSSFNLKLRAHVSNSENMSDFILLIDEPGQGLHEEAQKDAKRILNEIAEKGVQILFSTHQPQLIRENDDVKLSRLKLVLKSKVDGTKIKNPSQQTSQGGFKDALSPIRSAMGLITLDVTALIGSKRTVIVEGITDYYYIRAILKAKKIDDIALIPSAGVSQVPNIFSILSGWGVRASVIVDDDAAGTKALNTIKKDLLSNSTKPEIDKVLYQNSGCKGIEDTFSSSDFLLFANDNTPEKPAGKTNSDLAKLNGSKELIARIFADKIENGSIKLSALDSETKQKIEKILKFVKQTIDPVL